MVVVYTSGKAHSIFSSTPGLIFFQRMPEDVRRRYHRCHRRHASSRASAHNSSKALYRPSRVVSSPCAGPSDTVCEVSFSDGIKWAVHIPTEGDVCSPSRTRSFYLDMVTQCFISSKSSIPIPQIHYWFFNFNNILSRSLRTPYAGRIPPSFGTTGTGSPTSSTKTYSSRLRGG